MILNIFSGFKNKCKVKYETKCFNRAIYRDVTEDYPECREENVTTCDTPINKSTCNETNTNEIRPCLEDDTDKDCKTVKVNRCTIVKRTIRKRIPDTRCSRIPTRSCVKIPCSSSGQNCVKTIQYIKEDKPEEKCEVVQEVQCPSSTNNNDTISNKIAEDVSYEDCKVVVRNICVPANNDNNSSTTIKQLECNGTIIMNNP